MDRFYFKFFTALCLILSIETLYALEKPLELTILHINDHHSHLESESLQLTSEGKTYDFEVGGIARVGAHIKELKKHSKNPLVLHAGDAMSGTLYFTLFKGAADALMMNEIGFDAFTLGNHEFDEGDLVLAEFIKKADFPIISCNVQALKGSPLYDKWQPYIIKEIDGEPVGIIGLETAQKTSVSSRPGKDISFYDESVRTQKYVDELRSKGINKIILLSHFGYENDQQLAQKIEGVDIIIDGDSHSLLGDFSKVGLASAGPYPTKTKSKSGKNICIAQAWEYSKVVGELHVFFDKNGDVTDCSGTAHLLISGNLASKDQNSTQVSTAPAALLGRLSSSSSVTVTAEDPLITQKLAVYKNQIQSKANQTIGSVGEDLRHIRVPGKTYEGIDGDTLPFGSELAPIVAASFYDAAAQADASIQNAGGIRSGLHKGEITTGDVYNLLPFSNTLVLMELSGLEIKQLLEEALINFADNKGSDGSFPYAYALRYDINMSSPKYERLSNIEIKNRASGKWGSLSLNQKYTIVINSYIAEGRDGYTTLAEVQQARGKGLDTYLDYAMSFANYIQKHKSVTRLPNEERCIKSFQP